MAQAPTLRPEIGYDVPPLQSGDILTREEFERRWALHPEIKRAELLNGVVFVDVTVSEEHFESHSVVMAWLGAFWARHRELQLGDNGTVRFPGENDVQPDAFLRVRDGGMSHLSADRCVEGPPEFVCEVSYSSVARDAIWKKDLYRRGGVREYVLWQLYEKRLDWFVLEDGEYVVRQADSAGIIESVQFPGLKLDVSALLAGDVAKVLAALG